MKYFVLDKDGNITCYKGGYTTRKGADMGRLAITSPIAQKAISYTAGLGTPPGNRFKSLVITRVEENSEIIEVSEIIYKTTDGRTIIEYP